MSYTNPRTVPLLSLAGNVEGAERTATSRAMTAIPVRRIRRAPNLSDRSDLRLALSKHETSAGNGPEGPPGLRLGAVNYASLGLSCGYRDVTLLSFTVVPQLEWIWPCCVLDGRSSFRRWCGTCRSTVPSLTLDVTHPAGSGRVAWLSTCLGRLVIRCSRRNSGSVHFAPFSGPRSLSVLSGRPVGESTRGPQGLESSISSSQDEDPSIWVNIAFRTVAFDRCRMRHSEEVAPSNMHDKSRP